MMKMLKRLGVFLITQLLEFIKKMIKKTISLYPYFFFKIYLIFRSIILPVSKIESLLPKKGTILDVGCGYGFTSIFFALKNKNRKIIGSEINSKRVLIAQKVST